MVEIWIFSIIIGTIIGSRKGAGVSSFLICLLLGPVGIIFALLGHGNRKQCPSCKEYVHQDATICPHCRSVKVGMMNWNAKNKQ